MSEKAKCETCGTEFEQLGRGSPRRFCLDCSPRDPVAATRAWRERNGINAKARAARYAARPERACRECGAPFKARGLQVFCSRSCSKRAENRDYRQRRRSGARGKNR